MNARIFLLLVLLGAPQFAGAVSPDAALQESRALAARQHYDAALAILEQARAEHPGDGEIVLAIARINLWKGDLMAAGQELAGLGVRDRANPDARLLFARLAFLQGDGARAERIYREVIQEFPDYQDARDGLAQVQKARTARTSRRWRMDAGHEFSTFSRRDQPDWTSQFLQLTRRAADGRQAGYGKVTRYSQFDRVDTEYELGYACRCTRRFGGYSYFQLAPDADFRPDYRLAAGGSLQLGDRESGQLPVWWLVDARFDDYDMTRVLNLNTGLRVEVRPGWQVATRAIGVAQEDARRLFGWDLRLDGALRDNWRMYAGYAHAPETEAGITVDTRTLFAGMVFDPGPATSVRVGYARDDRENSWIRHVYNVSFTYFF